MAAINNDWAEALKEEYKKPYYRELYKKVNEEYQTHEIFPPSDEIFSAFHLQMKCTEYLIRRRKNFMRLIFLIHLFIKFPVIRFLIFFFERLRPIIINRCHILSSISFTVLSILLL